MFANCIAALNQQIPGNTNHVHCFLTQLTKSCLVLGRQDTRLLFLSLWKIVWIPSPGPGLMVSGIDLSLPSTLKGAR